MPFTYDENGALLMRDLSGSTFIALTDTPAAYAGNANKVLFVNATPDAVAFASNLYWDEVNDRLGVNTNAPDRVIYALTSNFDDGMTLESTHVGASFGPRLRLYRNSASPAVDDFVGLIQFDGENAGASITNYAAIGARIKNVGVGTEAAELQFYISIASTNTQQAVLNSTGWGINKSTPSRRIHATDDSASSGIIIPISRIESQVSGGAGAAGHGPGFEYTGETSTTENTLMTVTAARWSVATHASRRARFEIRNYYIGNEVLCGVIEAPATASADGNSRGVGSIDLQGYRSGVSQVAAAPYSALIAGQQNEIAGNSDASIIVGGYDHSIGATALYSGILAGYDHIVDGADYSGILGGREASTANYGQITRASGMFSVQGDAQSSDYVSRLDQATHVVNTWYSLYLDGASEQMVIPASSAWTFRALVVGLTANAAQQWSYEVVGLIERDNAGNTTLAASTTTTIFESDANYDCQAIADNVNEALEIQVRRTGGVDYSVQWVSTIMVVECTH